MPRIYIAGPMTGLPEFNYPAFDAAAAAWRAKGWDVENPAEHFGGAQDRSYVEYVYADIESLQDCDAIAMLPGWNGPNARGSVWERAIATHLLKIPVYDAANPVEPWAPDADPRAGQILVADVDEWRQFQTWKHLQRQVELIHAPLQPDTNLVPITRHPVTGALGRWIF